jgi:penicillin-binding protein 2
MPQPIPLKDHETEKHLVNRRLLACALLVFSLVVVLVGRLYVLQVVQHDQQTAVSENNRVHVLPIPPERGLIYDRNGVVLADNKPSFNLTMTRERAGDSAKVLDALAQVLSLGEDDRHQFDKDLRRGRKPFEPVTLMVGLSEEQIALIAVNQFRLPGWRSSRSSSASTRWPSTSPIRWAMSGGSTRKKPRPSTAPSTGAPSRSARPASSASTSRTARPGGLRRGRDQRPGPGDARAAPPRPGAGQVHRAEPGRPPAGREKALGDRRGAVVVLDPANGDVLAMVSNPSFDPNLFVKGISFKQYAALRDSIDRPLFNRVLRGLYAPGSTVKPEVAIAGLDSGVITPGSRVFDPGYYELPNYDHKYRNWNHSGDGWVDMYTAIMRSNDTYFYDLAHKLGIDRLHDYMAEFGLGQKVSLDMFEEAPGLMPSQAWKRATRRQAWFPGETLILGIGQGYMQVTPLQLAQATSLLASKGAWHRPHLAMTVGGQARSTPTRCRTSCCTTSAPGTRSTRACRWSCTMPAASPRRRRRGPVPHRRQERHRAGGGDQAG